jgi:hypothetical protein
MRQPFFHARRWDALGAIRFIIPQDNWPKPTAVHMTV